MSIAPSTDLRESFARRDFTINAMGWDPRTHELIDFFGGERDLGKGVLRHTSERFRDDPLRVLRGVQFAGRFGFRVAAETKSVSRELAPEFESIAIERIWLEWRKLATRARYWPEALTALSDTGWLGHFVELAETRGVPQDPVWHAEGDVFTHSGLAAQAAAENAERDGLSNGDREIAVLGALVHDFGKVTHTDTTGPRITSHGHAEAGVEPARAFLRRIGAPQHVRDRVAPIVREHMAHVSVDGEPSRIAVRRLQRRLHANGRGASIQDWARVVDADCAGRGRSAKPSPSPLWLKHAVELGDRPAPRILTGEHLQSLGLTPGPLFGEILAASIAPQDDEVIVDEATALQWLDDYLRRSP